jgi:hypothetical protein
MLKVLPHLIRTFDIEIAETQRGGSFGSSAVDGGRKGGGLAVMGEKVLSWWLGNGVEGEVVVKTIKGEKGEEIGRKEVRVPIGRKSIAFVNGLDVEIEVRE